jgi:hypothetical protein
MKTKYEEAISRDGAITGKGLEGARKMAGADLELDPVKINKLPQSGRMPERTRTSSINPLDPKMSSQPN